MGLQNLSFGVALIVLSDGVNQHESNIRGRFVLEIQAMKTLLGRMKLDDSSRGVNNEHAATIEAVISDTVALTDILEREDVGNTPCVVENLEISKVAFKSGNG